MAYTDTQNPGIEIGIGAGTTNYIPMFGSAGTLVNSPFRDNVAQNALDLGSSNLITSGTIYDSTINNSITMATDLSVSAGTGRVLFLTGNGGLHLNPGNGIHTYLETGGFQIVDYAGGGVRTLQVDNSGITSPVAGASGTFTTADAKTVTVVNGIITAIV